MPLNTNHPTPPKGASCSKVGIPEGVPRTQNGKNLWFITHPRELDTGLKVYLKLSRHIGGRFCSSADTQVNSGSISKVAQSITS